VKLAKLVHVERLPIPSKPHLLEEDGAPAFDPNRQDYEKQDWGQDEQASRGKKNIEYAA